MWADREELKRISHSIQGVGSFLSYVQHTQLYSYWAYKTYTTHTYNVQEEKAMENEIV